MRDRFSIGFIASAFALGMAASALAQESRPAAGERTGSAVSRSGGESRGGSESRGAAESRAGGSSGSGMSDGGSSGSSSSRSAPSSSSMPDRSSFGAAPERAPQRAQSSRTGGSSSRSGGESTGRTAVPRGSNGEGSRGGESTRVASGSRSAPASNGSSGSTGSTASTSSDRSDGQRRAVPVYSRPRDGRPVSGEAVARTGNGVPVHPIYPSYPYYYPYYYPYGFWGAGYGFGLGYLYYDPFWYGGYGSSGYGGGGYAPYYGGGGGYSQSYHDTGGLRLKIKPRQAQVYIDGYFVGEVDNFDGTFQKLNIDGGGHRVEIKADGYAPLQFEVLVTPGETVTYKGEMKRIQ
jgi:PEGA domain-containing protein